MQDGADWLYQQFYRLDRILWRTLRALLTAGPAVAGLTFKLNLTYRYDNIREGVVGKNPAGMGKRRQLAGFPRGGMGVRFKDRTSESRA